MCLLEVSGIRQAYPVGTRVELIVTTDRYTDVTSGSRGTVEFVDDAGTIHVKWDGKGRLGLIPDEDQFRKI